MTNLALEWGLSPLCIDTDKCEYSLVSLEGNHRTMQIFLSRYVSYLEHVKEAGGHDSYLIARVATLSLLRFRLQVLFDDVNGVILIDFIKL